MKDTPKENISPPMVKVVEKDINSSLEEMEENLTASQDINKSQRKEDNKVNIVKVEIKEKKKSIKSPDELYEEQISDTQDDEIETEEEYVDGDVIPFELEQAENEPVNLYAKVEIDETLIPKELQEVESSKELEVSETDDEVDDTLHTELDEDVEEIETKEVISDELRDLEEYGDIDTPSDEEIIPQ
jgi:hypothetical protein